MYPRILSHAQWSVARQRDARVCRCRSDTHRAQCAFHQPYPGLSVAKDHCAPARAAGRLWTRPEEGISTVSRNASTPPPLQNPCKHFSTCQLTPSVAPRPSRLVSPSILPLPLPPRKRALHCMASSLRFNPCLRPGPPVVGRFQEPEGPLAANCLSMVASSVPERCSVPAVVARAYFAVAAAMVDAHAGRLAIRLTMVHQDQP